MNILAIDTSSIYASCALLSDGEILGEKTERNGLVHSKSLMPLVESTLCGAGYDIADINMFACVAGPGSFTGVRIGVCAVKGLAHALSKKCVAINTLDCLKENVPYARFVCPIMDARRGQVYSAVYENGKLIREYDACPIEDIAGFLLDKQTVFLGDGVKVFRNRLIEIMGDNALFAPPQHNFTRASCAAYLAQNAEPITPEALDAIYLRKPQAEREYESKHS